MKQLTTFILLLASVLITACQKDYEHKTVICIPVYGQSLALGEEAERLTDFDSLAAYADGRIVTEELDHNFGYFENDKFKHWIKKTAGYQKRAYELSVYKMAQVLADQFGEDTLICIFPGGQGATAIVNLSKGTLPYQRFIENIQTAYETSQERGWDFIIPAICWMQGESDIVDYPDTDYKKKLDIKAITHQSADIPFICYQANSLTRAEHFKATAYECKETYVPQTFVDLLSADSHYWASGPTYPYACVNEKIHIDGAGQQAIGTLAAHSVLGILRGQERFLGLIPQRVKTYGLQVTVHFHVPSTPLSLDTVQVRKADNYGFSVINSNNCNIAQQVMLAGDSVTILCAEPPTNSRVRYAVNGDYMKSGNQHGPRGNLRDANGNWCYQFDILCK